MLKKIVWCIPFVLVVMLLSACHERGDNANQAKLTFLSSLPAEYTDNNATIYKYGGAGPQDTGNIQCQYPGKVVVKVAADKSATIWVFGPDQIDGANNCKIVGDGDLLRDDFSGTYHPNDGTIRLDHCVSGHTSSMVSVLDASTEGTISCKGPDGFGNTVNWIGAIFNAARSK
jgi:hypothetical protein